MFSNLNKIWWNTDGCAEHYIYVTILYLFSMLSQSYNITIDRGISATGHSIEIVDGLKSTKKMIIFQFMTIVQLPSSTIHNIYMAMHSATHKSNISLE